jgi:hypothetical protein
MAKLIEILVEKLVKIDKEIAHLKNGHQNEKLFESIDRLLDFVKIAERVNDKREELFNKLSKNQKKSKSALYLKVPFYDDETNEEDEFEALLKAKKFYKIIY